MLDFPSKSRSDNLIEHGCFSYIPAGATPTSNFRAVVLITYKPASRDTFDPKKFVTLGESVWDVRMELPDKQIRIIPSSEPFVPENYDEVIYLDPFDPRSPVGRNLDWVLGSAHYVEGKFEFPWGQPSDTKIVMDSGGAQIKLGTADFVDAKKVIHSMNQSANAGFALDVPPKINLDLGDQVMLDTLAKLQRRNNEVFLGERRDDLVLLNVLHGTTIDELRRWMDVVSLDGFNGWALGIDDSTDPLSGIRGALILYEEFKDDPDWWMHIFGVSGPKMIPAMAWLGKYHGRVSSDSSTWYEGSRRGTFFMLDQHNGMKNYRLSSQMFRNNVTNSRSKSSAFNDYEWAMGGFSPCQCEICSVFKRIDTYVGFPQGSNDSHFYDSAMIVLHDLLTLRNFGQQWNSMAQSFTFEEYRAHTKATLGQKAADLVEYVEIAVNHGLATAEMTFTGGPNKKHAVKSNNLIQNDTGGKKMNLFGDAAEDVSPDTANGPTEEAEADDLQKEINEEIEMERELAAEQVSEDDTDDEEDEGPVTAVQFGTDVQPYASNPKSGVDHAITVFYDEELSPEENREILAKAGFNINREPIYGWHISNEVYLNEQNKWRPAETTLYTIQWRGSKAEKTFHPPEVPEWAEDRVPKTTKLYYEQGSNMGCLLNYVDFNKQEDLDFLNEIDPQLEGWMWYTLYNDPYFFRMKKLTDDPKYAKPRKSNKIEAKNHEYYLRVRQDMEAGKSPAPYFDLPEARRKHQKVRGQKEAAARKNK